MLLRPSVWFSRVRYRERFGLVAWASVQWEVVATRLDYGRRGNEISHTRARCVLMNSWWIGIEVVRDHCVLEQWPRSLHWLGSRATDTHCHKNPHAKLISSGEGMVALKACYCLGEIVADDYPRNRNSLMNNASMYLVWLVHFVLR